MERVIDVRHCDEDVVRREPRRLGAAWARVRAAVPWAVTLLALAAVLALTDRSPDRVKAGAPPAWSVHVQRMDEALARGDTRAAIRPWNEAYRAALMSIGWEGMATVGEAYLRLTERATERQVPLLAARSVVARRLFERVRTRAHQRASREGLLRAAEGFAAIGDRATADECRELANRLIPSWRTP